MFELVAEDEGVEVVETAMFSTISALLLLVLVASEVTTSAAGTVEAAVEAEAAVVNTVTAAAEAAAAEAEAETVAAACALAAMEACDATEAAVEVG